MQDLQVLLQRNNWRSRLHRVPHEPSAVPRNAGALVVWSVAAQGGKVMPREELINQVVARFNAGETARQIAVALGVTRNVVAGIISRARQKGVDIERRAAYPRKRAADRPAVVLHWPPEDTPREPTPPAERSPATILADQPIVTEMEPVLLVGSKGIPLLQLRHNQCRYPVKEIARHRWLFCGLATQGNDAWCPGHKAIVFRPLPGRRRA